MKIAIMQPYFFPYIGYFQLINAVDEFVIYDNIEFTKKGWINRNRYLVGSKDEYFTLPLKKASDFLKVNQRELSVNFIEEKVKILRKIKESYQKAPYFDQVFPLVQNIFEYSNSNLFNFIFNSLERICAYLDIQTKIKISSDVHINHDLKGEDKVIAICKAIGAKTYLNPIGGLELYSRENFAKEDISLKFMTSSAIIYPQFKNEFISWLSIVDVMMFNSKEETKSYLHYFTLI